MTSASTPDLKPVSGPFNIQQVQGQVAVTHSGTVIFEVDSAYDKTAIRLQNVLFIESMQFNILSMQQLLATNFIPVYNEIPNKVVIKKLLSNGALEQVALLSASKTGRPTLYCKIFRAPPTLPAGHDAEVFVNTLSLDLLQRRLGHSGEATLQRLLREDMADEVSNTSGSVSPCDPWRLRKLTRPPHPAVEFTHGTTYALQLVVMDLAGPVQPRCLGEASYFLGFMDVFTRHSWVYTIRKKSDATAQIME